MRDLLDKFYDALSIMSIAPCAAALVVGENVALREQLAPTATVLPQVVVTANSALALIDEIFCGSDKG